MGTFDMPRWLKMGFLGFMKSGKTFTAVSVACGLHQLINAQRPIQFFDSEDGIGYQRKRIVKLTGMEPQGVKAQSFLDMINFVRNTQPGDIVVFDSVTHPWQELLSGCEKRVGKGLYGIMRAKEEWKKFSKWYISSPTHAIICGRAGFEFEEREDDHGNMKLMKVGTRMKTESDLGFEPSLLVEMQRDEQPDHTLWRNAIIKGDRSGVMDGRVFSNPTFETFLPFIRELDLKSTEPPNIDTDEKTAETLDDGGHGRIARARLEREILLEEIKNDITRAKPGQSAEEKRTKIEVLEKCFGTSSWTRLEKDFREFPPDVLRAGREKLLVLLFPESVTPSVESTIERMDA